MGLTLLILIFILMIAFLATSIIINKLQKNNNELLDDLQSHILQEFNKTEKPPN